MNDWKPMPKPGGKETDAADEATHEVRKRDLPGNAIGPDNPAKNPDEDTDDDKSLASEIRHKG